MPFTRHLFFLMSVLAESFFTLVLRNFSSFSLFSAGHIRMN